MAAGGKFSSYVSFQFPTCVGTSIFVSGKFSTYDSFQHEYIDLRVRRYGQFIIMVEEADVTSLLHRR